MKNIAFKDIIEAMLLLPICDHAAACAERGKSRGFTLIELIMVLVLLGVLAVFAAPKIFSSSDFYARGFHDQTLAMLRYAQKTAIAQRRTVCVTFTANSFTLSIASAPQTFDCSTPATLTSPTSAGVTVTGRSGIGYTTTPNSFNFDGLGQPISSLGTSVGQSFSVPGVSKTITVESATGYVHE